MKSEYKMKLLLVVFTLSTLVFSIHCRPQNVHPEYRATAEVLKLPFYGGARGQILEIRKNPDGTVISKILRDGNDELKLKVRKVEDEVEDEIIAENDEETNEGFGNYLENIQQAAANLVQLQENVKKTGRLTSEQKQLYTESLERLGVAAQSLAHFQTEEQDKDDRIKLLFEKEYEKRTSPGTKKLTSKVSSFPGFRPELSKKNQKNKEGEEEEENVGEETDETAQEENNEATVINAPEKESAIAEAKPVGLAIAGVGGVASSKPVATAVVGDGGLAVARPVATAIAGIKPSELSGLGIPISSSVHKKLLSARGKYGLVHSSESATAGILIGPDYDPESRASSRIESEEDDTKRQSFVGPSPNNLLTPNFDADKFLANLRLKSHFQSQRLNFQPLAAPNYAFTYDYNQLNQFPIYQPFYYPYYGNNNNWYPQQYSSAPIPQTFSAPQYSPLQYNFNNFMSPFGYPNYRYYY